MEHKPAMTKNQTNEAEENRRRWTGGKGVDNNEGMRREWATMGQDLVEEECNIEKLTWDEYQLAKRGQGEREPNGAEQSGFGTAAALYGGRGRSGEPAKHGRGKKYPHRHAFPLSWLVMVAVLVLPLVDHGATTEMGGGGNGEPPTDENTPGGRLLNLEQKIIVMQK